jgi:hypothetical protein
MLERVADDPDTAIEMATEPLEQALETLSFQLQTALRVESFYVIDADAEDAGRPAKLLQGTGDSPFPLRRFRTAPREIGGTVTIETPDLALSLSCLDAEQRLALDWYLKALATQFEMDRFLFLWIATECLWRRTVSLAVAKGSKKGQRIRAFLRKAFGVDDHTAKAMWTARQVVHGEAAFDPAVADALEGYCRHLRVGINNQLKEAVGLAEADPPTIVEPVLSVSATGIIMTTTPDPPAAEGGPQASGADSEQTGSTGV